MARKIFPHSLLGTIEIFAVIGIFSLYALEFAGFHTFSDLFPTTSQLSITGLSFVNSAGDFIVVNMGAIMIMLIIPIILLFYFFVLRKDVIKRLKK